MGSDKLELRCRTEMSRAFGHQSLFLLPLEKGHFSSTFASISPLLHCVSIPGSQFTRSLVISSNRFTSLMRSDLLIVNDLDQAAPVFQRRSPNRPFRARGRTMRRYPACAVDADPGPGEGAWSSAAGARPQGRQPHA